ncbi:MAG: carbohydrate porin [Thermoguttaceae bacterium]|jgi:high affinity Mn2+ porin
MLSGKKVALRAILLNYLLVGVLAASDDPVYDEPIVNETDRIVTEQEVTTPQTGSSSFGIPRRSSEVIRRIERDRLGELRDYATEEPKDPTDAFFESIEWGVVIEGELASNLNSNGSYRRETDAVFTADIGFLMHVGQKGTFYGLLEAGYGDGIDGRIPTLSCFNDEIEPDETLKFTELWYEQAFGHNESWRLRVGHLDLTTDFDTNNYANSGISQFNSTGFVANLTTEYPCPSFGFMLWRNFGEAVSVGAAYLASEGWNDVFRHGFGILETDLHLDLNGRPGNLRAFGWVGQTFEEYEGKTNSGWGINFDQEISHHLGVWGRVGQGDAELGCVCGHYSGGVQFQKFHCIRQRDVVGIGYGIAEPGDPWLEEDDYESGKEHFVEVYYRCVFNDFAHLSPFFQYVENPTGNKKAKSAFVSGLRGAFEI